MTLNRPEVLNAVDARLHTELVEIWNTIDRDPTVNAAVIIGVDRLHLRSLVGFGDVGLFL